jgi:ABC-type phosphate transport system permease subunit
MNDTISLIFGVIGLFVVISLASYILQPDPMKKGNWFTTPPPPSVKVVTFLLGVFFLFIFVIEVLRSPFIHFVPPVLAVVSFAYAFGAEKWMMAIQRWESKR